MELIRCTFTVDRLVPGSVDKLVPGSVDRLVLGSVDRLVSGSVAVLVLSIGGGRSNSTCATTPAAVTASSLKCSSV